MGHESSAFTVRELVGWNEDRKPEYQESNLFHHDFNLKTDDYVVTTLRSGYSYTVHVTAPHESFARFLLKIN